MHDSARCYVPLISVKNNVSICAHYYSLIIRDECCPNVFIYESATASFRYSVHSFKNWEEDSISLYNIKFYIVKNIRLWRKLFIYIESKLVATMVTNVRRLFVKCLKLFANYIFTFHILNFIFISLYENTK